MVFLETFFPPSHLTCEGSAPALRITGYSFSPSGTPFNTYGACTLPSTGTEATLGGLVLLNPQNGQLVARRSCYESPEVLRPVTDQIRH